MSNGIARFEKLKEFRNKNRCGFKSAWHSEGEMESVSNVQSHRDGKRKQQFWGHKGMLLKESLMLWMFPKSMHLQEVARSPVSLC